MTTAPRLVKTRSSALAAATAAPVHRGDPQKFPGQNSFPHYPDGGDNVHANVCSWLDVNCGDSANRWFIPGICTGHGHRYAKTIVCGKEWCPVCGKVGSSAHNRRYVRWYSKIRQFTTMRYFVLTIPRDLRGKYRTKDALKELGREAQKLMQRHGYKRGLRRWHWFGDKSHDWHPHLNILVEGSYIKAEKLQAIKTEWAEILGTKLENVYVTYKRTPSDMAGCLHYVTRSTFLDYDWDVEMAMELRNFRNMVVWGRDWKRETEWEVDPKERVSITGENLDVYSIEKLIEHHCPHGDGEMVWGKALPHRIADLMDGIDLGAGYKYIVDGQSPGGLDGSVKTNLQTMHLVNIAKAMGAVELNTPVKRKGYIRYNPLYPDGKELFYE